MKQVNIHCAKTHLSRILDEVRAGEDVVIAKAGKPYVKLVPVDDDMQRRPGTSAHLKFDMSRFFDPLPEAELDAWQK
ncbi:MAG: type II toxin-antitoxin system Phd/YefM family antitoxin [Rhodospirillaceae bacterium]|nr:type II toxin-antitoxin system Phd/YefM family antitoxin [Rhodospirillaceae bacterium]